MVKFILFFAALVACFQMAQGSHPNMLVNTFRNGYNFYQFSMIFFPIILVFPLKIIKSNCPSHIYCLSTSLLSFGFYLFGLKKSKTFMNEKIDASSLAIISSIAPNSNSTPEIISQFSIA